jgi:hypothetical protein
MSRQGPHVRRRRGAMVPVPASDFPRRAPRVPCRFPSASTRDFAARGGPQRMALGVLMSAQVIGDHLAYEFEAATVCEPVPARPRLPRSRQIFGTVGNQGRPSCSYRRDVGMARSRAAQLP